VPSFSLPSTLSPASSAPPRVLFFSHLGELHSRRPSERWTQGGTGTANSVRCKMWRTRCAATFGGRAEREGQGRDGCGCRGGCASQVSGLRRRGHVVVQVFEPWRSLFSSSIWLLLAATSNLVILFSDSETSALPLQLYQNLLRVYTD
jgi:hypothetical protein